MSRKKSRSRKVYMKPLKIVFIIPNMTGGGTERVISLLADEYCKMGHQVAIMQFAGYEHAYELNSQVEDFSIATQSKGNPLIWIKRLKDMRSYFKANSDCVIFAFCVMGAVFSVISTLGMKHYILVAERSNPDSCNLPKLRDWAYRRVNRITFQTEEGISYFDSRIAAKAKVIPNPIDTSLLPERSQDKPRKWVVTAGRLHRAKNQFLLLDSFHDFVKQFTDYELHVFGKGDLEEELKEHARKLGIEKKVVWHGFSTRVQEEIKDSSMFVLSSDYEGISNSMLEALAMGIPTISTDCPVYGARCYIENEVNGLLTPPGDRQALTEAMMKVASDPDFARKLSINGKAIRDKYSLNSIAKQFLQAAEIQ